MSHKFGCQKTGMCCSHIRGFVAQEDRKFFEKFAYGKLPLVQLIPIDRISFPLWDFEAQRFKSFAKQNNIQHKILPSRAVYDQNEQRSIIFTYSIDSDACTFLDNGLCSIYPKRAFICRMFPFQKSPFLKTDESLSAEFMLGSCPSVKELIPHIPKDFKEMVLFYQNAFGDHFLNAISHDLITQWANEMIIEMMKRKIIRPTMNYPYEFLLKRIEQSEKVDLTDYLVEKGMYTEKEMKQKIHDFEHLTLAKQKVREVLGNDFDFKDA